MDETMEERADWAYLALIHHMDACAQSTAAGGVDMSMCDPGVVLRHRWDVAEHRAAQARAGDIDAMA